MVEAAWYIVERFLKDWQRNPLRWLTKTDVQAELYSRLTRTYRMLGIGEVAGNYDEVRAWYGDGPERCSRVSCNPCIYFCEDGRPEPDSWMRPDLVVWSDIQEAAHPPDTKKGNWPVAWTCEIKYPPRGESDQHHLPRFRALVVQEEIDFGCWLHLVRTVTSPKRWVEENHGDRVWSYRVEPEAPGGVPNG